MDRIGRERRCRAETHNGAVVMAVVGLKNTKQRGLHHSPDLLPTRVYACAAGEGPQLDMEAQGMVPSTTASVSATTLVPEPTRSLRQTVTPLITPTPLAGPIAAVASDAVEPALCEALRCHCECSATNERN